MREVFLTGSRAYGAPRDDSDVDLVILVTPFELELLSTFADRIDQKDDHSNSRDFSNDSLSLRFGKLNLLAFASPVAFAANHAANGELVKRSRDRGPVGRADAIKMFRAMRDRFVILGKATPTADEVLGVPKTKHADLGEEE